MTIWLVLTVMAVAFGFWIVRPFLGRAEVALNESDSAISIFRDQADEVKRDLDAGLISSDEYDAAQKEIEKRTLTAARTMGEGLSVTQRAPLFAAILAAIVVAGSFGVYLPIGNPEKQDQPLAARAQEMRVMRANAGDLNSRLELLIEKTLENPESFEDWWMLARTYSAAGDHASATDAYRRASELSDDRPAVLSAYAESMTLANGNKVPQAARLIFQQVLQKTPDPRARYYVALSKAQEQDFDGALAAWTELHNSSKPDAPWMPLVRRDIVNMARFLKRDVSQYLKDASPAEIARATGQAVDRQSTEKRIATLDARLAKEPKDYKGWIELTELHSSIGQTEKATKALAEGRNNFAAAPFVLTKFDEAARNLGLDLVEQPAVRGPSDEDIAAAASLSKEEQDDMIKGMIAGLAAKLEENPNNPNGWVMLVRSYNVSGDLEKARKAYETAKERYKDNPAVLAQLNEAIGS